MGEKDCHKVNFSNLSYSSYSLFTREIVSAFFFLAHALENLVRFVRDVYLPSSFVNAKQDLLLVL